MQGPWLWHLSVDIVGHLNMSEGAVCQHLSWDGTYLCSKEKNITSTHILLISICEHAVPSSVSQLVYSYDCNILSSSWNILSRSLQYLAYVYAIFQCTCKCSVLFRSCGTMCHDLYSYIGLFHGHSEICWCITNPGLDRAMCCYSMSIIWRLVDHQLIMGVFIVPSAMTCRFNGGDLYKVFVLLIFDLPRLI